MVEGGDASWRRGAGRGVSEVEEGRERWDGKRCRCPQCRVGTPLPDLSDKMYYAVVRDQGIDLTGTVPRFLRLFSVVGRAPDELPRVPFFPRQGQ